MDTIPFDETETDSDSDEDEADAEEEYEARFDGDIPEGDGASLLDRPIMVGGRTFQHDLASALDLGARSTTAILEELPRTYAEVWALKGEAARHVMGLKGRLERQKLTVRLEIMSRVNAAMSFAPAGTKPKKPSEKQIDWDVSLDPRVRAAADDYAAAEQVTATLEGWATALAQAHASALVLHQGAT